MVTKETSLIQNKYYPQTWVSNRYYIFNQHGHGNATLDLFSDNSKVDFVVVTNGSPVNLKFIFTENNETNERFYQ